MYKIAMAFWINIYGCQPQGVNSSSTAKESEQIGFSGLLGQPYPRPILGWTWSERITTNF
jgi:hypothetical protein